MDMCLIAIFLGGIGLGFGVSAVMRIRKLMKALMLAVNILRRNGYGLSRNEYRIIKSAVGDSPQDI